MARTARPVTPARSRDLQPQVEVSEPRQVVAGVDTHKDTHTAAVIDPAGRLLGHQTFLATGGGYAALLGWVASFGQLLLVGIEGTGVYGAGLATYLHEHGVVMVEVDRPDRKARRWQGKSDPVDAEAAARAALAARATGTPKDRRSAVEVLRVLRVARRSAVGQRSDVQRQIKALVVTAPEALRARLRVLPDRQLLATCARLRPDTTALHDPAEATKHALRTLAARHAQLSVELTALDTHLDALIARINPDLVALNGVGTDVAGQLLVTAGANPDRSAPNPRSPCSAESPRYRRPRARPAATASTAAATDKPTPPSTGSCSADCAGTPAPRPTPNAAPPKACPRKRSSAASND